MKFEFNPNMAECPKDKPVFLILESFKICLGHWCPEAQEWAYAEPYCDGKQTWFENDIVKDPIGWAPWPEIA